MSLLLNLLSVIASCTPSPALEERKPEQIRAFISAINARDEAAVGNFLAPGATYSNREVQGISLPTVMTDLISNPAAERLDIVAVTTQDDAVLLRTRTPSGSIAMAVVRLSGGCIRTFHQLR